MDGDNKEPIPHDIPKPLGNLRFPRFHGASSTLAASSGSCVVYAGGSAASVRSTVDRLMSNSSQDALGYQVAEDADTHWADARIVGGTKSRSRD